MNKKFMLSSACLVALVGCGGGEEEIVYEPSPLELPTEYILTENDKAPAFYADVLNGVLANSIYIPEEDEVFEERPIDEESLTSEEKALLEKHASILAEEAAIAADIKAAETAAAQDELTKYNNRISSILLVSAYDPSEKNADLIAEAEAVRAAELEAAAKEQAKQDKLDEAAAKVAEKNGEVVTQSNEELLSNEEEIKEEELPPVTAALEPHRYTYATNQTGETGGKVTGGYADILLQSGFTIVDIFHPIDGVYYEMLSPDYTQRAGSVAFAKKMSWDGELFFISVDWTATGAEVVVSTDSGSIYIPPAKKEEEESASSGGSLSIQDALNYLNSCNPADLGLAGNSMNDYKIYTLEGLVMVDSVPYRQFDVYSSANGTSNTHVGSYLFSNDGVVLEVDGSIVRPLNIANVHDVLAGLEAQA